MYKKKLIKRLLLFYSIAYTCLFLPMIVLCIVNREEYFVTNKQGLSVAFGGILLLIYVILLAKVGFTKLHQAIRASMVLVIMVCLKSIISDLVIITLCYWVGVVTFSIFQIPAHRAWEDLKIYRSETVRIEARTDIMNTKREKKKASETINDSGRY